ncbi:(2Fe-2S)-binding protein [Candidatus Bathyarchaeota archaeon]|nr:(2Fe-2S)-binding protein [Candidatus Bathyarchaeota archaeon]
MRVIDHPILGKLPEERRVIVTYNGEPLMAIEGEPILATLIAHGIKQCRTTRERGEPRWFYCGIGRCTDCVMTVNGVPNVRTCITPVEAGMKIETQTGLGKWDEAADK